MVAVVAVTAVEDEEVERRRGRRAKGQNLGEFTIASWSHEANTSMAFRGVLVIKMGMSSEVARGGRVA